MSRIGFSWRQPGSFRLSDTVITRRFRLILTLALAVGACTFGPVAHSTDIRSLCAGFRPFAASRVVLSYGTSGTTGYCLDKTTTPTLTVYSVIRINCSAWNSWDGDAWFTGTDMPAGTIDPAAVFEVGDYRICELRVDSHVRTRTLTYFGSRREELKVLDTIGHFRIWSRGHDGTLYRLSDKPRSEEWLLTRFTGEGKVSAESIKIDFRAHSHINVGLSENSAMAVLPRHHLLFCSEIHSRAGSSIYGSTTDSLAYFIVNARTGNILGSAAVSLPEVTHGFILTDSLPPPKVFDLVTIDTAGVSLLLTAVESKLHPGNDHRSSGVYLIRFDLSGKLVLPSASSRQGLHPVVDIRDPVWGLLTQDPPRSRSRNLILIEYGSTGEIAITRTTCQNPNGDD